MHLPLVTKVSLALAGLFLIASDNVNLQLSGTMAVSAIGSLLALLLALLGYFIRREFEDVKKTQKDQGVTLQGQDKQIERIASTVEILNNWKHGIETEAQEEVKRLRSLLLEKR